jgi:hypothetical protein
MSMPERTTAEKFLPADRLAGRHSLPHLSSPGRERASRDTGLYNTAAMETSVCEESFK